MAGAKVPLTFRIFKGDQLQREERLSLSVIKLGKVPSAHLKLDDETVSRMHAIIEVNGPGDVSIIDLGSTKGTFVNGQKVNKAKLQSGDTIVVGETRIELAIGAGEDEEVTRVNQGAIPSTDAVISSTPRPPAAAQTMPAAAPPIPRAQSPVPAPPAPTFGSQPPAPLYSPPPLTPPLSSAPPTVPLGAPPPAPTFGAQPQAFGAPQTFGAQPQAFAPAPVTPPSAPMVRPPPGLPGGAPMFGSAMAPPVNFQQAMAESVDDIGGARAVEVAAMLGDSVVAVKHCIDPRSGQISPITYALFAIGALTLLSSGFAFYKAVDNAAFNHGHFVYETQVLHKPAFSVRDTPLWAGYDWMMFAGLAIGLGTMTLALARMRAEQRSPFFRIGTAPGVEFATEGAPHPAFPLVAPHGDDFAFNFGHGMDGEMIIGGQSTSLAELAAQGRTTISPIPPNAKIRVRTGKTMFLISAVPQPRRAAAALFAALESRVLAYFAGSLAVHMIFWFILNLVPVDDSSVNADFASNEDLSARSSSTAQEDPNPEEPEDEPDGAEQSGGSGQAMTLDEGTMGKKESARKEGLFQIKKNQEDPQLARAAAIEQAANAGILGSAPLQQGGAFASLTSIGDISSGFNETDVYGGLSGDAPGEMQGGWGYGRTGYGSGGGGTGWGTIGTGRYGTIGHGSGTGSGYGVGGGRGGMRGRTSAVPTVAIGTPNTTGDLDKAIIRRYIKRNLSKITYCYEKELLVKPSLAGVVSTQFLITGNGNVQSSTGSGVDPAVASCVAGVIKAIEFPKPKGGGNVQVNYPFTFRPAGS